MKKPKAIRAFSLDIDVITMLEKFAAAHDTWGKKKSRSKIVNDAIRYHITGGYADKLDSVTAHEARARRCNDDHAGNFVCLARRAERQSSPRVVASFVNSS